MGKILIACDIGNTNIDVGLFCTGKLVFKRKLPTKNAAKFGAFLKGILAAKKLNLGSLEALVICSVVPSAARAVKAGTLKLRSLPIYAYAAGENLFCPLKSLYRKHNQLVQDRLVNAYAGMALYGAPVIVVSFGTAITFDVVSKNKEHLGGMILPGLEMSKAALFQHTALLPEIKLVVPREFLGRDTKSSILSGIVYGNACLTDNLVGKIRKKIGASARVIATGGNSGLIKKYSSVINVVDDSLTLKGLELIYRLNNK